MDHREIKLLIMGMVVLALMVSCPDSGQVELGAVSGLSPADGTSTTDTTPTLSWDEVPDAAGYEVQLDDSKAELEASQIQSVTDTSYTPSSALANEQTHYWKVRAKDAGGQYGPWSAVQSLRVEWGAVSGLSPADAASTTDTTPSFSWTEVSNAAEYEVRLADSQDGLENAPSVGVTDTSHTPSAALTNLQTYYWQVRAKDGTGLLGPWSNAYSLQVEWGTISGPSPADGSTTENTTPTFGWTGVSGAAEYELRLADGQDGFENAPSVGVTDTSHTPSAALTNLQTYYWQVRAKDGTGQFGPWSNAYSLRVEWGTISGPSPADGGTTENTTPTFGWTGVSGAAEYELRLADGQDGLENAQSVGVTDTSHTPSAALTNLQTYYWQVRAKDGTGQFGPWSNAYSLRVEWGTISGLSPADGSTTGDTTPTLSWTGVSGAAEYELRLADGQDGLENAQSVGVTDTSYTPSAALTKGPTYYWQVRAKDGAGQKGAWSEVTAIQIVYFIGDTGPAGGIVFYDRGNYSDGWRYLEAAPSDQSTTGIQWGGYGTSVDTSTAIGTGKANTEAIVTKVSSGSYAAKLCYDLVLGGYDDWFLPSKDELNELYKQEDVVGGFKTQYYWSSSEDDSLLAWLQAFFFGGSQFVGYKNTDDKYVRAVRSF